MNNLPTVGELNQRIEIVCPIAHLNENGYPIMEDERICRAWARVSSPSDSMVVAAGALVHKSELNFVIRYRDDVDYGMIVIFMGKRYDIVGLDKFDFKKRFLGIRAVTSSMSGL